MTGTGSERTDLLAALTAYAQLPGVRLAGLSALVGAGVVLVAALLIAIVMPQTSLVDLGNDGAAGLIREVLNHACGMTLAPMTAEVPGGDFSIRVSPLLFVAFPIGGCALGAYLLSDRNGEMGVHARLGWGLATAVPFALVMLIISLFAGTTEGDGGGFSPAEAPVFLLSLVWGAAGGVVGIAFALRRDGDALEPGARAALALRLLRSTLVPLVIALAITAVVGTGIWVVQAVRDAADARTGRSAPTAIADDVFFAGDFGLRYLALGAGAQFRPYDDVVTAAASLDDIDDSGPAATSDFLPIPLGSSHIEELLADGGSAAFNPDFTVYGYGDVLPSWLYAPLLLILIVAPAFLALSGGFGAARSAAAATPIQGALWGALVGPVWAIATAILAALTQQLFFGQILGDSFFAIVLLAGAALGALGGLVATQQAGAGSQPTPAA